MNKIFNLSDFRQYSPVFIETGTNVGGMILQAQAAGFREIRSVELDDALFAGCVKQFFPEIWAEQNKFCLSTRYFKPGLKLWHGRSEQCLEEMLQDITEPAVILLDAHPSGPGTGGHEDLMRQEKASEFYQHNILMKELQVIAAHQVKNHIILIDDQHGQNAENAAYQELLFAVNPQYQFSFIGPPEAPQKMLLCLEYDYFDAECNECE